jgi:hypothetical protein
MSNFFNIERLIKITIQAINMLFIIPAIFYWGLFLIIGFDLDNLFQLIEVISKRYHAASLASKGEFRSIINNLFWYGFLIIFVQSQLLYFATNNPNQEEIKGAKNENNES